MANLRSLVVSGAASFGNPPVEDEQPIRRAEYEQQIALLAESNHAPLTVAPSKSFAPSLAPGTQNLTGTVRRKTASLTATEGLLLETDDGLVVKLGTTADSAAPGTTTAVLQSAIDGKAAATHAHAIADVTGLQTALDGKALATHAHAITDVSGLSTALASKAASDHTHPNATPTAAGLMTADDKQRLDSLVALNLWLPSVISRNSLPLNVDPIDSIRLVGSEGIGGRLYRHISNVGLVTDQWTPVSTARASGLIGDGVRSVIDYAHNLNTADVEVMLRYAAGGRNLVDADWAPLDPNTIRLTFAAAPLSGSLRINVFG